MAKSKKGGLGFELCEEFQLPQLTLCVSVGCVERFTGDAIVNAANEACLGGGGVDGAISKAGGKKLLEARKGLPAKSGKRCPTGQAVVTIGGALPAKWCIHAVAPRYPGTGTAGELHPTQLKECDSLLENAAKTAMKLAAEKKVKTIAFPILGGIFRGCRPLRQVVAINLRGILEGAYEGLQQVHIVVFPGDPESLPVLSALLEACKLLTSRPEPEEPEPVIKETEVAPTLAREPSEQVQAIFREWDTNCDGRLSIAEMARVLAEIGISQENAARLFDEADLNKDGMLDYAEFMQWLYVDSNQKFREHVFKKASGAWCLVCGPTWTVLTMK